jgi:pyruvate/2-oxoglutarate dehydrogenase complex dihydrolipoamide dehydrogenase (E3) component
MTRHIKADIVVIGAGSGGLSVASGAAQLGLKTVLFEKGEMGGDCLNYGCVPSKALISAASTANLLRHPGHKGVGAGAPPVIDFAAVMAHVHRAIATIAPHDSQERFEGLGCTVIRETARFAGLDAVESDSVRVTARKIVVATGSRAKVPNIPGLDTTPYLTNESLFELTTLPEHLIILGAGPIGLELGQAFVRLGSRVTVLEADRALPREDADLAAIVIAAIRREGVDLMEGAKASAISGSAGAVSVTYSLDGEDRSVQGSHLLVATGRAPSVEGLNLSAAGIGLDERGAILTDDQLLTTNKRVFAIGDVSGQGGLTHTAGAHAGLVIRKALFAQPIKASALVVPRATYTDPEIAAVGLSEAQARALHGDGIQVITADFSGNDRAVAEGRTDGMGKLILSPKGQILGVAMVGPGAGDLIQPWVLAMTSRLKLSAMTAFIAPYPTRGELNKRLAGQYFTPLLFSARTRLLVSLLKWLG